MRKTTYSILLMLCLCHFLNDGLQVLIQSSYPLLKDELLLSFTQIGLITLVYQITASIFQPVIGLVFDKLRFSNALTLGMIFTIIGVLMLANADSFALLLMSVATIGIGSSIFHPESSRLAHMASGGKRGMAQSLFQVGGNLGRSIFPLLVALMVTPYGRENISYFAFFGVIALLLEIMIARWFRKEIKIKVKDEIREKTKIKLILPRNKTIFVIGVLIILIFSKYVYLESIKSYYTFYLLERFGVSISYTQFALFIFLMGSVIGTMIGGMLGDKIGRKPIIWISILGTAPFSLLMPYATLEWTLFLSFMAGFMLSSAFPAIIVYAQELLPGRLGLISGLFYGFSFGVAGIASAVQGNLIDVYGIEPVYRFISFAPLLGFIACLLPSKSTDSVKL